MPKKRKQHLSKAGNGNKSMSTPGKAKGTNCHKSPMKTQYAKDPRFYRRDPYNYALAAALVNKEKGNGGVSASPWIEEILNNR